MRPPVREEAWRLHMVIMALVMVIVYASSAYHTETTKLKAKVSELEERDESRLHGLESYIKLTNQLDAEVMGLEEQIKAMEKTLLEKDTIIQKKDAEIKELRKKETVTQTPQGSVIGSNFEVTFYNDYGHTKSGRFVEDGVTVAVDPAVIPIDSWLKLEFPDGREMIRRADDTGGAVKGHIVDVYMNESDRRLRELGRVRGVKVTLLRKTGEA